MDRTRKHIDDVRSMKASEGGIDTLKSNGDMNGRRRWLQRVETLAWEVERWEYSILEGPGAAEGTRVE